MSRNKYSIEFKIEIAKAYIEGKGSYHSLANKYKVCHRLVRDWTKKYLNHGESAFYKKVGNACYSSEFKIMCVEKVLSGIGSVDDIVAKYNISDRSVLLSWISKYNANRILKDYDPKRESIWRKLEEKQLSKNVRRLLNTVSNIIVIIKELLAFMMFRIARYIPG